MALRWPVLCLALALAPLFAKADSLSDTQSALTTAQQTAAAHKKAAAAARAHARMEAAKAALLAEQQIAAAAALRKLEDQTGDAATQLATLQTQSQAAAQTLATSEAALAKLLPIMQRLASQPAAIMLAVPESPNDAIRGVIILQGIAAQIETQAAAVKTQSTQVAALLAQTNTQQSVLADAVAAQQKAEDALTAQITAAKSAEMADAATAVAEAAAAIKASKKVHGLQDVIGKLQAAAAVPAPESHIDVSIAGGGAPVAGPVIQRFGDATMAGPAVGVSYRAAPGARVVTPCAGPVLFANQFQTYGNVVIMDCGGGYDFVLSGMQHLDVAAGQRLSRGQPVGEMLPFDPHDPTRRPVLYVELRQNGTPVDPGAWLKDGGSG